MTRLEGFRQTLEQQALAKEAIRQRDVDAEEAKRVWNEQKLQDYLFLLDNPVSELLEEAARLIYPHDSRVVLSIAIPAKIIDSDKSVDLELAWNIQSSQRSTEKERPQDSFPFVYVDQWNSVELGTKRNKSSKEIEGVSIKGAGKSVIIPTEEISEGALREERIQQIERVLKNPAQKSAEGNFAPNNPQTQISRGIREEISFEQE